MGYGRAPKTPSYNLQSVVDVESGLIVHHDVYNDANDSHLLHPMSRRDQGSFGSGDASGAD